MTASSRSNRAARPVEGPFVATVDDIPQLNEVFTEAFTERYRKDGMTGVRVPPLNPSIWQYAIEDAGDGGVDGVSGIGHAHAGDEGCLGGPRLGRRGAQDFDRHGAPGAPDFNELAADVIARCGHGRCFDTELRHRRVDHAARPAWWIASHRRQRREQYDEDRCSPGRDRRDEGNQRRWCPPCDHHACLPVFG